MRVIKTPCPAWTIHQSDIATSDRTEGVIAGQLAPSGASAREPIQRSLLSSASSREWGNSHYARLCSRPISPVSTVRVGARMRPSSA
jgi:hypothetical protein